MNFLEEQKIHYIPQKTFSPLNKSKYRFDFYIPKYNLAIEYQGEQHFRDNSFFKDGLDVVQKRDEVKRNYCKENKIDLLEISYKDYNLHNSLKGGNSYKILPACLIKSKITNNKLGKSGW